MLFWNLANLREEFRLMAQVRSAAQMSDVACNFRINRYYCLNFGLDATPNELKSIFSFQTDEGVRSYSKPDGVLAIIGSGYLSRDAEYKTGIIPVRYLANYEEYPIGLYTQEMGTPNCIIEESGTFSCVPIPDATYTISMPAVFQPAALASDTALPLIQDWGMCIAAGAAYDYLVSVGNIPRASEVANIKLSQLNTIATRNIINSTTTRNPSTW